MPTALLLFLVLCFGISCEAVIIVISSRTPNDYSVRKIEGYSGIDPLEFFNKRSRATLCKILVRAQQFIHLPTRRSTTIYLNEEGSHENSRARQRSTPAPIFIPHVPIPVRPFEYIGTPTFIGKRAKSVKVFPCIQDGQIQWNVTFGLSDKYLYLLEPSTALAKFTLRVTAIIEPSALPGLSGLQQASEYFVNRLYTDFQNIDMNMINVMQFICKLSYYDTIRVCSSAYSVLNIDGHCDNGATPIKYVTPGSKCTKKSIILKTSRPSQPSPILLSRVLPCIISGEPRSFQFYVSMDSREEGSIFIMLPSEKKIDKLVVVAQAKKVGALLNPGRAK